MLRRSICKDSANPLVLMPYLSFCPVAVLRMITGEEEPDAGTFKVGDTVKVSCETFSRYCCC